MCSSDLFEGIEDTGESGDCIMVFGSHRAYIYRVPTAVELYKDGRAPYILMSGGKVIDTPEGYLTEAEAMANRARALGITDKAILIEKYSVRNTKENVLGAMLLLDHVIGLQKIKRILAVSTLYHMRRCELMLKTYLPAWIGVTCCPSPDISTLRDNWYLSEEGRTRAMLEASKITQYIREGNMMDFEIDS